MGYIQFLREKVGNDYILLNAVAVIIENDQGQILLQKRSDNHLWGLPGGLIEVNESIESAAIREVKEETNLDIEVESFIGVFNNPFMRWRTNDYARIISFCFKAKVIGSEMKINDDESLELKFFHYTDLPMIHSIDTLEMIQAYHQKLPMTVEGKRYHG